MDNLFLTLLQKTAKTALLTMLSTRSFTVTRTTIEAHTLFCNENFQNVKNTVDLLMPCFNDPMYNKAAEIVLDCIIRKLASTCYSRELPKKIIIKKEATEAFISMYRLSVAQAINNTFYIMDHKTSNIVYIRKFIDDINLYIEQRCTKFEDPDSWILYNDVSINSDDDADNEEYLSESEREYQEIMHEELRDDKLYFADTEDEIYEYESQYSEQNTDSSDVEGQYDSDTDAEEEKNRIKREKKKRSNYRSKIEEELHGLKEDQKYVKLCPINSNKYLGKDLDKKEETTKRLKTEVNLKRERPKKYTTKSVNEINKCIHKWFKYSEEKLKNRNKCVLCHDGRSSKAIYDRVLILSDTCEIATCSSCMYTLNSIPTEKEADKVREILISRVDKRWSRPIGFVVNKTGSLSIRKWSDEPLNNKKTNTSYNQKSESFLKRYRKPKPNL